MNKFSYVIIGIISLATFILWKQAYKTQETHDTLETIIIGTNAEFEPFSFKKDTIITGFDIDVITEVFKRLDRKIIIKDMPFDALIPAIQMGKIHMIAAGMTPTEERAKRTLFTQPHLLGDPLAIISPKEAPLKTLDELKNKRVVVNEGYTADTFISSLTGPYVIRISSSFASDGILALQSGRADAYVTALRPMEPYFTLFGKDNFTITPIPNTEESSAFAISKHYPELRDYIQIMLDKMEEDGTLTALKQKWGFA